MLHDPIHAKFRPKDQSALIRLFGWGLFLTVIKKYALVLIMNLITGSFLLNEVLVVCAS
ncbi:hypothetical protein BH23THE1_BH23THE1_21330 [soil metagenome]